MNHPDLNDRILGALCLAGIGDALGAPTEQWTIDEIRACHGGLVTRFVAPTEDTFAGALGGRRGEVTDDTSQLVWLARALVAGGGRLAADGWLRCLLDWAEHSPKATFMGPSTALFVAALREGRDLARVGTIGRSLRKLTTTGITNGAAMRVAPCGWVHPGDIGAACEQAFITCLPSHETDVAISAACAIAAGAAQALVSDRLDAVIGACVEGAAIGERLGRERARAVAGPRLPARLDMALRIAEEARDDLEFMRRTEAEVGNGVLACESVAAAIGLLAYAKGDPLRTVSIGASMGNDTDTIAAMAGALCGGLRGARALPAVLCDEFLAVNEAEYRLTELAAQLSVLADRANAS
ncbi:ADP-ribosylglycohydrolase family protein [Aquincola sp. S2]|uniref:ADP-ribosylglycohydrolase family protein n=1 Tax=Pseudaquabacterium terrae TaxID=2732868 RepID=A0ABX2EMI1_9BURK|nr:ADP-ribosylglycohydrolase family protein [Aquabacterium terrae]NRF69778.1 ADP-ribosylglycohydrolase family protein [Aquabacterium terrae]